MLQNTLNEYRVFDERNASLDDREKDLDAKEYNLKLTVLQGELDSEKEKSSFAKSIALGLVRNAEYRKHVFDNENQGGYYDGNGKFIQPAPINKSLTENKTQD